jgi:hypothetical protein
MIKRYSHAADIVGVYRDTGYAVTRNGFDVISRSETLVEIKENEMSQPDIDKTIKAMELGGIRGVYFDDTRLDALTLLRQYKVARELVAKQAEDDGMWIATDRITYAWLQRALRDLHDAVEGAP